MDAIITNSIPKIEIRSLSFFIFSILERQMCRVSFLKPTLTIKWQKEWNCFLFRWSVTLEMESMLLLFAFLSSINAGLATFKVFLCQSLKVLCRIVITSLISFFSLSRDDFFKLVVFSPNPFFFAVCCICL